MVYFLSYLVTEMIRRTSHEQELRKPVQYTVRKP